MPLARTAGGTLFGAVLWGWACSRIAIWSDIRRQAARLAHATRMHETTEWLGVDGFEVGGGRGGGVIGDFGAGGGLLVGAGDDIQGVGGRVGVSDAGV